MRPSPAPARPCSAVAAHICPMLQAAVRQERPARGEGQAGLNRGFVPSQSSVGCWALLLQEPPDGARSSGTSGTGRSHLAPSRSLAGHWHLYNTQGHLAPGDAACTQVPGPQVRYYAAPRQKHPIAAG